MSGHLLLTQLDAALAYVSTLEAQRDQSRAEAETGWRVAAQHARQRDEAMAQRDVAITAASDALAQVAAMRAALIVARTALSDEAQRMHDWSVVARRAHALIVEVLS